MKGSSVDMHAVMTAHLSTVRAKDRPLHDDLFLSMISRSPNSFVYPVC